MRSRLISGGTSGNGGSVRKSRMPAQKDALPVITFERDVSLHRNGEDTRAPHLPAGRTDGDAIIFFPKANVVHMGDDYVRYGFPFTDVDAGGSIAGRIAACEAVIAQLPAPWRERYSGDLFSTDTFLETPYHSLKQNGHTPFVRHA